MSAEQIARGLTEKERHFLLKGNDDPYTLHTYRIVGGRLVGKGLTKRGFEDFFELTPLGLAVRTLLETEHGNG